jgi:phosphate transport system substrate-binding protein
MNSIRRAAGIAAALVLSLGLMSCADRPEKPKIGSGALSIQGAGATFPAPLYTKWLEVYTAEHPEVSFSYDAVGSGEGIKRFIAGEVDFGASDAAMKDEEMAQVTAGVQLVPATAGMVVLAYNIWGLEGDIKLKRDVYVDIFLGKITKWNDPRIVASNPHITLPDMEITPVVRLDSSGTTFAFTNHLSAVSEEWRNGPGTGKLIDWPGRASVARGNDGVAGRIKLTSGAIGYVEYGFAKRLGLSIAWLENKAGKFVQPSAKSGQLALQDGKQKIPRNLRVFLPDPDGEGSYPIVSYSWLLLYKKYPSDKVANAIKDAVWWGLTRGQPYAEEMGYIPLPQKMVSRASEIVDRVHH